MQKLEITKKNPYLGTILPEKYDKKRPKAALRM